ncbi:MAG: zinc ribbon domain-containing protein [Elusimicrobiota bacterium]
MPQPHAVIRCTKCGFKSNVISDTCIKCGSPLEKICGSCEFANSVVKNYCDQCGVPLILTPHPESVIPPPSDKTMREMITPEYFQRMQAEQKPAKQAAEPDKSKSTSGISLNIWINSALAFMLVGMVYILISPQIPKYHLLLRVKRYLNELSKGNYARAYETLSINSKSSITLEEYIKFNKDYYAHAPSWEFRKLKIFLLEKNAALIKYELKEGTSPWKEDYISFVKEHGKWVRSYIFNLFEPIEQAIEKQDYAHALYLAQKLNLTDPVDPRTWGYLCWTEYTTGLYDKAVESCKKAIESSRLYPVGFTSETIFWFQFHIADSLRASGRFQDSIKEYDNLLMYPGLPPGNACQILMNRSDAFVRMKDYVKAVDNVLKAHDVCPDEFQDEVSLHMQYLNGDARDKSIEFARQSRLSSNTPPIIEMRKLQMEELSKKLGPKGKKYLPRDFWVAVHLSGPEYRVMLREERIDPNFGTKIVEDIYSFQVNLWTRKIFIEKDNGSDLNI